MFCICIAHDFDCEPWSESIGLYIKKTQKRKNSEELIECNYQEYNLITRAFIRIKRTLRPATINVPKPMVRVHGRPIICSAIESAQIVIIYLAFIIGQQKTVKK